MRIQEALKQLVSILSSEGHVGSYSIVDSSVDHPDPIFLASGSSSRAFFMWLAYFKVVTRLWKDLDDSTRTTVDHLTAVLHSSKSTHRISFKCILRSTAMWRSISESVPFGKEDIDVKVLQAMEQVESEYVQAIGNQVKAVDARKSPEDFDQTAFRLSVLQNLLAVPLFVFSKSTASLIIEKLEPCTDIERLIDEALGQRAKESMPRWLETLRSPLENKLPPRASQVARHISGLFRYEMPDSPIVRNLAETAEYALTLDSLIIATKPQQWRLAEDDAINDCINAASLINLCDSAKRISDKDVPASIRISLIKSCCGGPLLEVLDLFHSLEQVLQSVTVSGNPVLTVLVIHHWIPYLVTGLQEWGVNRCHEAYKKSIENISELLNKYADCNSAWSDKLFVATRFAGLSQESLTLGFVFDAYDFVVITSVESDALSDIIGKVRNGKFPKIEGKQHAERTALFNKAVETLTQISSNSVAQLYFSNLSLIVAPMVLRVTEQTVVGESDIRQAARKILSYLASDERDFSLTLGKVVGLKELSVDGRLRKESSKRVALAYAKFIHNVDLLCQCLGYVERRAATLADLKKFPPDKNNFTAFLKQRGLKLREVCPQLEGSSGGLEESWMKRIKPLLNESEYEWITGVKRSAIRE